VAARIAGVERADIDDDRAGLEYAGGRLRHEQRRFDIGGEMFVEGFLGRLIERCCLVDRGVVY